MFYLSQVLGAPVEDLHGTRIGKIRDITVPVAHIGQAELALPSALLVDGQAEQLLRAALELIEWHGSVLRLQIPLEQLPLQQAESAREEVRLADDVLDRQVIDIVRKRTVRVNDVCLGDDWCIQGIDNSTLGLVRRLAPAWLLGTKSRHTLTSLIPWAHIELIGRPHLDVGVGAEGEQGREGTVTVAHTPRIVSKPILSAGKRRPKAQSKSGQLAELHPADIAEIVHQLTPGEGAQLIGGLDDETAADAMEEIDTERQRQILENIAAKRAAVILEAMGPDEAADLLSRLPEERAQELLRLMTPEESEDVQELLEYKEDSAGGMMTTDYIALNQTKSVAEALEAVRLHIEEQDIRAAYIYCVADESQDECALLGIISLWDLLVAQPAQPLQDLMETDVITVQPDTEARSVAEVIAKYNLLAVPVVSTEGVLEGIVTVDDALDVLLPTDRRRKPTRMY